MPDNMGRIFGGCAALAGLWILVYWWWQPAEPRIRFDDQRIESHANTGTATGTQGRHPQPRQTGQSDLAVIPPGFREYTIRRGDTLGHIAQRELGSATYASAISRANPYINFDEIREGRTILIPIDPSNIQGRPVTQDQPPAVRQTSALRPSPSPAPIEPAQPTGPVAGESDMVEYTVQSGDTLTLIARRHYGSIRYAMLIYEANRDQLESEDDLDLGQVLRLPPKPD